MDYLSFDVGIKNLAYCILSPDKTINGWGILNLNDNPICQVSLRKKCDKQASYIVKDDVDIDHCCTAHSKRFKKVKKLNANHDIFNLSQTCIERLRELDLSTIKTVLIENQPALKNPVMKSVQMMIYTFFIVEGVMNPNSPIEKVHMVNARNKLTIYEGPHVECTKTDKYAKNKFLSVEYTRYMIQSQKADFNELFDKSKKKDDLADAYLQGIYWILKRT
jgi:hypothetical protein